MLVLVAVPSPKSQRYEIVSPRFGSLVPELLVEHVRAMQFVMNCTVGATFPGGSTIVIGGSVKTADVMPQSSLTVSVRAEQQLVRRQDHHRRE